MADLASRWSRFLAERHPPSHQFLVLVFALAQAGVAAGGGFEVGPWSVLRLVVACAAFFLLLRLCDEEKDLEEDRRHRPGRPLARGLVNLRELRAGQTVTWAAFPAALATMRPEVLGGIGVTLGWTWLMRREFFATSWLRPRLTRYALAHTLVLIPFGATCLAFAGMPFTKGWPWCLALWFAFNFFEFSRKTFHPSEEIPGVDSYTARFGAAGALGLSAAQILAAGLCLRLAGFDLARTAPALVAAVLWTVSAGLWLLRPSPGGVRLLRRLAGLVLLGFLVTGLWHGV